MTRKYISIVRRFMWGNLHLQMSELVDLHLQMSELVERLIKHEN